MATVKIQFRVVQVTDMEQARYTERGEIVKDITRSVKLFPVGSVPDERSPYFYNVPTGSIELGPFNADSAKAFTPGREFIVSIAPAPKARASK